MGALSRLSSSWFELRCNLRMFKHAGKFTPAKPWSASRLLEERVRETPQGTALAFLDRRYTWSDFDARVNQYAHFFASKGITKGDVVALLMDNRPDYIFIVLGLNRLGAAASLINTQIKGAALSHAISVCKPKAVLVGAEHEEQRSELAHAEPQLEVPIWTQHDEGSAHANDASAINGIVLAQPKTVPEGRAEPNSSDLMCFIYTSGTTGLPKPAIISNRRWMAAAYMFGGAIMDAKPSDVVYVALPLYHSSAMYAGLGAALTTGATLALRRKFSASHFWEDVATFNATIFLYIGELCRYLLNTPVHPKERAHRLRLGVGNGLRPDVWGPFQERFSIPLIREFYGATEGNAPIVNFEGRPGMVGRLRSNQVLVACDPVTGELLRDGNGHCKRVAVGEKGILLAKITKIYGFDGYVDKAASQKKLIEDVFGKGDRHFNSGDLLQLYEDGWVSFADRIGDTFRWKGENVSTNEVAEILNRARGVLESNVYGVTVQGSEGRAGMAALLTNEEFDLGEFAKYVCGSLPSFQRPYFVRVLSNMRVTGTFKHQKVDYRDEGYDPAKTSDALYFLDGDHYVKIDAALYKKLKAGEIGPR